MVIIITIIIILLYQQHGYHSPSLATLPYRSSLPAGLQGYSQYPHRAAICSFKLVALLLLDHVRGSVGNIIFDLVPASPAVSCMSGSSLIVFLMDGRWPYRCCLVVCCLQELFNIARNIIVLLPSSFFSTRFVSVHLVHPYSSINPTVAWKKLRFISSVISDFHMTDRLLIAVHAFVSRVSMSVLVDGTLFDL